ncbi:MAG: DUF3604 domain-containing protein, partial [Pseudomonadales bacterium]|nr:DUF3604 domain-containing protein [Pseudomonadales bacterium]
MKHKIRCSWVLCACTLLLAACSTPEKPVAETAQAPTPSSAEEEQAQTAGRRFGGAQLKMPADVITGDASANAKRNAYFGDLHVHTDYSFDAYAFGTVATPYDAYKYAKGQPIRHPAGFEVKLRKPLDFYAVTDHAMFLGGVKAAADTSTA